MCSECPEFLRSCYVCGRGFRAFEYFYVVRRLMDEGGVENRWYGIRYARCQDCPRPSWPVPNWNLLMGEGRVIERELG